MKWDLSEVGTICAGAVHGTATVAGVTIDSREVSPGSLFVAVAGERDDGHRYLDEAMAAGASAVLVGRGRRGGHTGVEVDDTLVALRDLAADRRSRLSCPVIAITGSNGKTTTKDFVAAALGDGVHASPRSYNNDYGVPLTVLGAPDDVTALVVEVGSRGRGHIAALMPAVRPTVSVITTIGRAHLEMFGSVAGVLEAKWELVAGLGSDGVAVLPIEDDRLLERATGPVITFGETADAGVAASEIVLDDLGRATFILAHGGATVPVSLPVPGRHQPRNAAAAVAAAIAAGHDFQTVAGRLGGATVSPWRMELASVPVADGDVTVLNDAYNANPDSVRAALETLSSLPGRQVAVLGKMHELGDEEAAAHREVGALATSLGIDVVAVGDDPGIADGAGDRSVSVADAGAAADHLRSVLAAGDVVLVKASRAAGLETIPSLLGGESQ